MGSVSARCEQCTAEYRLFRSCRNRSCPLCQSEARAIWLAAREEEILPVPYVHVVFNVPSEFNILALCCPEQFYDALMRAAGQAVIDVGWSKLHVQLGCLAQLHTWGQNLALHPHVHCVVPAGGFSKRERWVSFDPQALSVKALSARFRVLLCRDVRLAARQGKLSRLPDTVSVDELLATVLTREWHVYAEPPFGGPEMLLEYLSKYTYRVAISNDRIESYEDHQVTFRWRDYRDGKVKTCTLDAMEFLRRFLLHVPPTGFVRIRSYGFMGNRNRKHNVERARQLIGRSEMPGRHQTVQAIRLCPECYAGRRDGRMRHTAPEVAPQFELPLRPPPSRSVAA